MATKTLSITEEAYDRLMAKKKGKESFSEVILNNFPRRSLLGVAGILSNKEAERLRLHIEKSRKLSKDRLKKIAERLR